MQLLGKGKCETHLDGNVEDLDNDCHHVRIVGAALETLLAHQLLQLGEEMINELFKVPSISLIVVNREFKCLKDGLECAQCRRLIPLIVALLQALRDLLGGVGGPRLEVHLRDVVDDVLDGADDDLARRVRQMHHTVKCAKNLLLEHLTVGLRDGIRVDALLLVH